MCLSVCSCKRTTFLIFSLAADSTFVHLAKITSTLISLCWVYQIFTIFDYFFFTFTRWCGYIVKVWWRKWQTFYSTYLAESNGERILKIDPTFGKLWTKNIVRLFLTHRYWNSKIYRVPQKSSPLSVFALFSETADIWSKILHVYSTLQCTFSC